MHPYPRFGSLLGHLGTSIDGNSRHNSAFKPGFGSQDHWIGNIFRNATAEWWPKTWRIPHCRSIFQVSSPAGGKSSTFLCGIIFDWRFFLEARFAGSILISVNCSESSHPSLADHKYEERAHIFFNNSPLKISCPFKDTSSPNSHEPSIANIQNISLQQASLNSSPSKYWTSHSWSNGTFSLQWFFCQLPYAKRTRLGTLDQVCLPTSFTGLS